MIEDRLLDLLTREEASPNQVEIFDAGDLDLRGMRDMIDLEAVSVAIEKLQSPLGFGMT